MERKLFKYESIARDIEENIRTGVYRIGDKLPSIRNVHKQLNMSIVTVNKAFEELERIGLIEARPKSGYYVKSPEAISFETPQHQQFKSAPAKVSLAGTTDSILSFMNDPTLLPLGAAIIDPEHLPYKYFSRTLKGMSSLDLRNVLSYGPVEGDYELRRQIAQRMIGVIDGIKPEDIIITNGCVEAISICLQGLVQRGETIAIESPTYFLLLQLLQELGIMAVEIPTTPQYGLDVDAFESIAKYMDIKACLLTPNFNNPLGSLMTDEAKEKLVHVAHRFNVPIIEDDVYSELYYQKTHPSTLKTFDHYDIVLSCSSFSKTLFPGLRIGWIIPGKRFKDKICKLRGSLSISSPSLNQFLISEYLLHGGYDRHLRALRQTLKEQTYNTALAIHEHFPSETKLAMPQGGFVLWIELPINVDSIELFNQAIEHKILIIPGIIFTNSKRYKNYIRISCGYPFTEEVRQGIITLGNLVKNQNHG